MRITAINQQMNTNRINQNASVNRGNITSPNQYGNVNFGTKFDKELRRFIRQHKADINKELEKCELERRLQTLYRRIYNDRHPNRTLRLNAHSINYNPIGLESPTILKLTEIADEILAEFDSSKEGWRGDRSSNCVGDGLQGIFTLLISGPSALEREHARVTQELKALIKTLRKEKLDREVVAAKH